MSTLIFSACLTTMAWGGSEGHPAPPYNLASVVPIKEKSEVRQVNFSATESPGLTEQAVGGDSPAYLTPEGLPPLSQVTPAAPAAPVASSNFDEIFDGPGYEWQVLPVGLMYKAYLAGEKESRMASVFYAANGRKGAIWENTLGAHVGLLRYGTTNSVNPQGWQFDLEGAAMPRVDMGHEDDLEAVDFRAGWLITHRRGPNAFKAGYYHLSSHVGDEYLIRNIGFERLNYVRDSLIIGWTRDVMSPNLQVYGEIAWAVFAQDGAQPLELQYGIQYSPLVFGLHGAPFAAINGHTRQEFNYTTSISVQAGWQWRGVSNHTLRTGVSYYEGPSMQWSFVGQSERMIGAGIWFDF
ncbi:DUF1207 domain-containing protein [Schlesneria sp.]|uniref:DUF1207 domain-containing protein n=1 Tax=Schlesneria sp. TaxID=2762018 RepID=UPI002EEF7E92